MGFRKGWSDKCLDQHVGPLPKDVYSAVLRGGCGWGGRVVVLQPEGRQFNPQLMHAEVSLSKMLNPELCLIEQQSAVYCTVKRFERSSRQFLSVLLSWGSSGGSKAASHCCHVCFEQTIAHCPVLISYFCKWNKSGLLLVLHFVGSNVLLSLFGSSICTANKNVNVV